MIDDPGRQGQRYLAPDGVIHEQDPDYLWDCFTWCMNNEIPWPITTQPITCLRCLAGETSFFEAKLEDIHGKRP